MPRAPAFGDRAPPLMTKVPAAGATRGLGWRTEELRHHRRRTTMHTTAGFPIHPRRVAAALTLLVLAVFSLVAACGSDGDVDSGTSAPDPVNLDDRRLPDGRDVTTVPWDEVGPGWTLVAYDPGSLEESRTAGLFLVAPDGRRWAVTAVDLGERHGVGVEDWLPAPPQAVVARRHHTDIDENPQPGGLDLVDLETGELRELTMIDDVQVNVATLSRPTGRVVVFADGVGGPLQRRSSDFELLSTVAAAAFDWVHSPDGSLLAVGTLLPTEPSRLTVNANDTGAELIELPIPSAYRFCHPVMWWDDVTLAARCGNTGVVEPAVLWRFPVDGAAPQQLLAADGSAVVGVAQQPDGTRLLATTEGELWPAGDDGSAPADLPNGAVLIGASTTGALVVADGELLSVEIPGGATVPLLSHQADTPGVVSAVTLTAGDFTAEWPAGADEVPARGGQTGEPGPPAAKGPEAGTVLDVVGVRYDDALNFRVDPDPSADIVATARPDVAQRSEDAVIVAIGEAATSGTSVWWQVTVDGEEAWANSRYLGVLGVGGDTPELIDLEATGDQGLENVVAEARSPGDATGVLLEVVGVDAISSVFSIDVLGGYGDGVKGERFEIEAYNIKADDPDATPYVIGARIMSAVRIPICEFGVDPGGGCL